MYLCNQCQNLLKSKKHLESKLKGKIEEIDCKLGFLMERSCVRNRKRPLEEDDSETRPDKVIVSIQFCVLLYTDSLLHHGIYLCILIFSGGFSPM